MWDPCFFLVWACWREWSRFKPKIPLRPVHFYEMQFFSQDHFCSSYLVFLTCFISGFCFITILCFVFSINNKSKTVNNCLNILFVPQTSRIFLTFGHISGLYLISNHFDFVWDHCKSQRAHRLWTAGLVLAGKKSVGAQT